jgi:TfoX/Sxy family transcriptional regulator of competence genes
MAHNEELTNRLREALVDVARVEEKKMFRGISFMVNGKMCMSTGNQELMCRIDPALHNEAVEREGVRSLVMKGREYKGYIYVHEDVIKSKKEFDYWVNLALDYNKYAKAAKKKKAPAKRVTAKTKIKTVSKIKKTSKKSGRKEK